MVNNKKSVFYLFRFDSLIVSTEQERNIKTMRDFRLPPRCKWSLRSSGLLRQRVLVAVYDDDDNNNMK